MIYFFKKKLIRANSLGTTAEPVLVKNLMVKEPFLGDSPPSLVEPPGEIVNKQVSASGPADFSIHRPCFREGEFLKTSPRQVSPLGSARVSPLYFYAL